jgi:hypothetical protein
MDGSRRAIHQLKPPRLRQALATTEGTGGSSGGGNGPRFPGGVSETIPTTIQASLLARLDRLGTAKQVAQNGAIDCRSLDPLARTASSIGTSATWPARVHMSALETFADMFGIAPDSRV